MFHSQLCKIVYTSLVSVLSIMLGTGCGSGSSSQDVANVERAVVGFEGITSLEQQDETSWLIRWDLIDAKGIVYGVFAKDKGDEYNFRQPIKTDVIDSFLYKPENIFKESAKCFVVRVINIGGDENTEERCTDPVEFGFSGAEKIEQQSDGAYIISWQAIPLDNVIFTIFDKLDDGLYDFERPSFDAIKDDFYKTDVYPRGEIRCFIVRYGHKDLPVDENDNEVCTNNEDPIVFGGIQTISRVSSSEVRITWNATNNSEVEKFHIFQGSDFKELVQTADASETSVNVSGLVPGRQYSFGLRAVDFFGREDENIKILSIIVN